MAGPDLRRARQREVVIRDDNQGVEDMLLGTTIKADGYDFAVLDDMMMFDGDQIMPPVGQESIEWLGTLSPDYLDSVTVEAFAHGS